MFVAALFFFSFSLLLPAAPSTACTCGPARSCGFVRAPSVADMFMQEQKNKKKKKKNKTTYSRCALVVAALGAPPHATEKAKRWSGVGGGEGVGRGGEEVRRMGVCSAWAVHPWAGGGDGHRRRNEPRPSPSATCVYGGWLIVATQTKEKKKKDQAQLTSSH